jgi:hypothetical protein
MRSRTTDSLRFRYVAMVTISHKSISIDSAGLSCFASSQNWGHKIGVRSDIWTRTQLCANPVKADLNLVFGVIFKAKRRHLEEPILTQQCR